MRRSIPLRAVTAAAAAGALALAASAGPAGAVDDSKPAPCGPLLIKDANSDQTHLQVPEGERTPNTEIIGVFLKHDPAKGAEALTANVIVKEFAPSIPAGWTTQSWNTYYTVGETVRFVRAIFDFSGASAFEYGTFVPNPTGVGLTGVSSVQGTTQGKFFEGPEGVIQVVIPADQGKPGDKFDQIYSNSGQGRTLPASFPSPNRGLTQVLDTAPDDGLDGGGPSWTITPCAAGTPIGGDLPPGVGPNPGGPPPSSQNRATDGSASLPVKLSTTSVKAKATKRKKLSLKLRSTGEVTNIAAQLVKGKKVVGKGKLAKLKGSARITLKLAKALKKGSYRLDLVGDSGGRRGVAAAKLKVK